MAAIIEEIIPIQNFEFVLNKIGVILLEEITNQKAIQPINSDFAVYIERQEPYSKEEDVVISVSCNSISYAGFNTKDLQGDTVFFVDIYCGGVESSTLSGNSDARIKIHKYVGMIRYILSSAKYLTLGFPMGFIGGKYLKSVQFDDNYGNQDGSFIRFARLTFNVRIQENQLNWDGTPLDGNDTQIKLNSTNKGFQLTFNN